MSIEKMWAIFKIYLKINVYAVVSSFILSFCGVRGLLGAIEVLILVIVCIAYHIIMWKRK